MGDCGGGTSQFLGGPTVLWTVNMGVGMLAEVAVDGGGNGVVKGVRFVNDGLNGGRIVQ